MALLSVDFNSITGKIKPMHGVCQPPMIDLDTDMFKYLKEAAIPFSRLHDVGGMFSAGRFVDIPNLFCDFSADPRLPESYDFTFTDVLISALVENGIQPFFRLGVSIENYAELKAYNIYPPADSLKWAKICEGVIRHYNEGWANGFHYNIEYWEIWNEPDNYEDIYENQMWRGTKEQFFELYETASTYLKKRFPQLKIGGYSSCGLYSITSAYSKEAISSSRTEYFIEFFNEFLTYIKERNCPLDFFSWHSYSSPENNVIFSEYARKKLDECGYKQTETTCNEWNYDVEQRGTLYHASVLAKMLIMLQNASLDSAMFYDAGVGVSPYAGLFNPITLKPFPAYYSFFSFGKLFKYYNTCAVNCDDERINALAAVNEKNGGILIVNATDGKIPFSLDTKNYKVTACNIIKSDGSFPQTSLPDVLDANSVIYVSASRNNKD